MSQKQKDNGRRAGKYRFFYGIRFKMTMGLLLVFLASGFFLYMLVNNQMTKRMEEQITSDMNQLWQNGNIYTRQLLVTYGQNNDEAGFKEIWSRLKEELAGGSGYEAVAYNCQGTPLSGALTASRQTDSATRALFEGAKEGKAAYRMVYNQSDSCRVTFVMPVLVADKQVGILSFDADYSDMQRENSQFVNLVIRVTAAVFALSFLLCFLMLSRILSPVLRLSRLSNRVSRMVQEEEIESLPTVRRSLMKRRDEIGDLAVNYSRMLDTMRRQFRKIEGDKEQILALLESRQEFFDNATHELKTPLTTIQGYAQLMQADGGADRQLLDDGLNHILKESSRLHQMVVQLLEMSDNLPSQEMELLEMAELTRSVASAMELKARRYGCTLEVSCAAACRILGQENKIRQLLINLIDNAIKYGEENSPILLKVARQGGRVSLAVENRGPGIPEEALEHIFTPFFRVDKAKSREKGSAGLGLSICQKIVEAHGGNIFVKSAQERTVFWVEFSEAEDGEGRNGEQ